MTALKVKEKSLKWDKKIAERKMEEQIGKEVQAIVQAMATEAKSGSFQHGSYLIDRVFGKTRQNIGIDGGQDGAPIVFMPSTLVAKFALDKPLSSIEDKPIYEEETNS